MRQLVSEIGESAPGLEAIWLIGSRASGTAKASSDWDFIALGTSDTLAFLQSAAHFHRNDVDFLVVTNGDDFEAAWGEKEKRGSLSEWKWCVLPDGAAEYMQSKWVDREDGAGVRVSQAPAFKVWPEVLDAL